MCGRRIHPSPRYRWDESSPQPQRGEFAGQLAFLQTRIRTIRPPIGVASRNGPSHGTPATRRLAATEAWSTRWFTSAVAEDCCNRWRALTVPVMKPNWSAPSPSLPPLRPYMAAALGRGPESDHKRSQLRKRKRTSQHGKCAGRWAPERAGVVRNQRIRGTNNLTTRKGEKTRDWRKAVI